MKHRRSHEEGTVADVGIVFATLFFLLIGLWVAAVRLSDGAVPDMTPAYAMMVDGSVDGGPASPGRRGGAAPTVVSVNPVGLQAAQVEAPLQLLRSVAVALPVATLVGLVPERSGRITAMLSMFSGIGGRS